MGQPQHPVYLLITPCRNEIEFATRTLDSVLAQTILPREWIIVDDGSTDGTLDVLRKYEADNPCIRIIERTDRGHRKVGGGVIDAFNAGLKDVDLSGYEYLCKLDLDLELPTRYFENLISRMAADERLGTCSGKAYYHDARGELVPEVIGDDVSLGMTKFYRVNCFEQIGGFVSAVMWDGIDCHECRRRGWKACSWDSEDLRFLHLRPMGSSHKSLLTGRGRHGQGQYFMGTGIVFMVASAIFRLPKTPAIMGSIAMLKGYFAAALRGDKRYGDSEFRKFLRNYQWSCLFLGKSRAIEKLDRKTRANWKP